MKKNNKAFTLIELLAIIVILAIIAVITVPIILNIIENSRKGASIDSAYGYRDSVQQYYLSKSVNGEFDNVLASEDTKTVSELEQDGLTVSGQKPSDGWVTIDKGQVVDYSLKFGDYVVSLNTTTNTPISEKKDTLKRQICDSGKYVSSSENMFAFDESTGTITGFKSEYDNGTITEISIPCEIGNKSVIAIGTGAFQGKNLGSVIIPDSITIISDGAFYNNVLNEIIIPDSVSSIGTSAFAANELRKVKINSKNIGYSSFKNNQISEINFGSKLETIGTEAFVSNKLTKVVIPNNVTTIGDRAFTNNEELTEVTIPQSAVNSFQNIFGSGSQNNKVIVLNISEGVTNIPNGTFENLSIEQVNLPQTLTTIGNLAFKGNKMQTIILPNGVTDIGEEAFNGVPLTSLTLSNNLVSIGKEAFNGAPLTSLTLPNNLETIGKNAFAAGKFTEIEIPSNVKTIDDFAFAGVPLENVLILSDKVIIGKYAFTGNNMVINVKEFSEKPISWDENWHSTGAQVIWKEPENN